jgi:hypothetical protein
VIEAIPPTTGSIWLLGRPRKSSKPGLDAGRFKLLIYLMVLRWVPNGPSEHPQRKSAVRETFRASGASPRCTAVREKRPNSWAFQGGSADGETVCIGNVGGGRGTVNKPSPVGFSMTYEPHKLWWVLPGESRPVCGGFPLTCGSRPEAAGRQHGSGSAKMDRFSATWHLGLPPR